MLPGLHVGDQTTWCITVSESMVPSFEGTVIHPVLSTVAMVHYMEWVGRRLILPYLSDEEEGIGGGISVTHLAPAPVGTRVDFYAEATALEANRVECRVWAEHAKARIGEGTLTQFILPKWQIEARIEAMRVAP